MKTFTTQEAAEDHAGALLAAGLEACIGEDPDTGEWIVDVAPDTDEIEQS